MKPSECQISALRNKYKVRELHHFLPSTFHSLFRTYGTKIRVNAIFYRHIPPTAECQRFGMVGRNVIGLTRRAGIIVFLIRSALCALALRPLRERKKYANQPAKSLWLKSPSLLHPSTFNPLFLILKITNITSPESMIKIR